MIPELPALFRSPDWGGFKPYLSVQPPLSLGSQEAPDVGRPAQETVSFDRSREVTIPWGEVVTRRLTAPGPYLAAFREWIENTWPSASWAEELASVVVRATSERPFYHIHRQVAGRPWLQLNERKDERQVVLLLPGSSVHFLVEPEDGADDLYERFLQGGESYDAAWSAVEALVPVVETLPGFPFPLPKLGTAKPSPFEPGWGVIDPPKDFDLEIGRNLIETFDATAPEGLDAPFSETVTDAAPPYRDVNPKVTGADKLERARKVLEMAWNFDPTEELDPIEHVVTVSGDDQASQRFWRLARVGAEDDLEERTIIEPAATTGEPEETVVKVPRTKWTRAWEALAQGEVLVPHRTLGLWYRLVPFAGDRVDASSAEAYERSWGGKVADVELVVEVPEERRDGQATAPPEEDVHLPEMEELDLSAQVIRSEFRRLEIRRQALAGIAPKRMLGLEEGEGPLDLATVDAALARYESLEVRREEVNRSIKVLREQARALGYFLAEKDGIVHPFRDVRFHGSSPQHTELRKTKLELEAGELYQIAWRARVWKETIVERRRVLWHHGWPWWGWLDLEVRRDQTRGHRFLGWNRVLFDESPLEARRRELEDEGYRCFVFGSSEADARTAEGVSLRDVMSRCELDEAFRRRCALLLPRYEESMTLGRVATAYTIVKRPLPGFAPVGMPRLFLEERLAFRTRWLGVELGELVHSVNLAPGETRTVSVHRRFSGSVENRRSVTSLLDITSTARNDLTSEIERERRRERIEEQKSNWSVKASGSFFGIVSAGAGGGGSHSKTTKDFARDLNRLTRKASRSLSEQQREEVVTSSSSTQTTEVEDSSVGELTNINQGATLNLLFFRLLNVIETGLHLDELRFLVHGARELVGGTGIVDQRMFTLRQLPEALRVFLGDARFLGMLGIDGQKMFLETVRQIETLLLLEYVDPGELALLGREELKRIGRDRSSCAFTIGDDAPPDPGDEGDPASEDAETPPDSEPDPVEKASAELYRLIRRLKVSDCAIAEKQVLQLPSGALWVDSALGVQPGVEPYAERIREAEYRSRLADVEARRSKAAIDAAVAAGLSDPLAEERFRKIENHLEDVELDEQAKRLTLELDKNLAEGLWVLTADGSAVASVPREQLGRKRLTWTWSGEVPPWADRAAKAERLVLVELAGRKLIGPRP